MSRPLRILLAAVGIATPLLVGWFVPIASGPPLCTFRNLTGYDCPGCGLTRSVVGLLHGDVGESLRAHPLGAGIFVAGMLLWGSALVAWARGGKLISPVGVRTPTWAFVAFFAVYLGVYVLRLAGLLGGTADPPAEGIVTALWR